jgi:hypothetical protein
LVLAAVGVIWAPWVALGICIRRLGYMLLRSDPKAEDEARFLHEFAVLFNIVLIAIGLIIVFNIDREFLPIGMTVVVGYGAVAFAHAEAMRRCAARLHVEANQ